MHRLFGFVALLLALDARAVTIDWMPIGNPNNSPDTLSNCYSANCGSVASPYFISKYETTNAQYVEFLNAKAVSDPLGLYNTDMGSDASFGGITQSGVSGSYTYAAKAGFENKPVVYVSFSDSLRFANWMNNGQGNGETETGAYTLLGGTATPTNALTVTRNPDSNIFLTGESEWYKAAYYDPISATYFDYPTGTNTVPGCVAPSSDTGNSANCGLAVGALTDVGAYGLSASPYGTFDQGGNVEEWNEAIIPAAGFPIPQPAGRGFRGGSLVSGTFLPHNELNASFPNYYFPDAEISNFGFRIAMVPEPGTALLVTAGVLGLAASRRPRRQAIDKERRRFGIE